MIRIGRDHVINNDNDDDYESRLRSRLLTEVVIIIGTITALNASAGLQEGDLLICYIIKNYLLLSVQCAVTRDTLILLIAKK
jgi:hypothetical protein